MSCAADANGPRAAGVSWPDRRPEAASCGTAPPGFTANGGVIGFLLAVYRLFRQGREILHEEDKPPHAGPERRGADEDEGSSQPGGQA